MKHGKSLWSIFITCKDIVDIINIYISNDNWEDRRVKTHYKGTGEVTPKSAFRIISNYDPNTQVASTKMEASIEIAYSSKSNYKMEICKSWTRPAAVSSRLPVKRERKKKGINIYFRK